MKEDRVFTHILYKERKKTGRGGGKGAVERELFPFFGGEGMGAGHSRKERHWKKKGMGLSRQKETF